MHLQSKKIAYSMNMFARVFLPVTLFQSPDLGWLLGAFFEDIFPWIVFAAICTAFFQGLRKRAAAGKKQS